jgi:enoyl-CoA hydratase/carnithine racemase
VTEPLVDVTRAGAAAVVALRRERKLNALSSALEQALGEALDHPDVRASPCVVITGSRRAFSAGADVTELRDLDPAAIADYYRETGGVYERVARLPQPTISAIAGHCLGGGFELALACDLRYAAADAKLGQPEIRLGVIPGAGGTHRIAWLAGVGVARDLCYTGRQVEAEEAKALGLIERVLPARELPGAAIEDARTFARGPRLGLAAAKEAILEAVRQPGPAGLRRERELFLGLFGSADQQEGMRAFLEKRPPAFRGA